MKESRKHPERVAVFGVEGRGVIRTYHLLRSPAGTGQTQCGRWYDSTCKRQDATRGGVRLCKRCAASKGRAKEAG